MIKVIIFILGASLGGAWIFFLYRLSAGQGIVNMDFTYAVLDWSLVGVGTVIVFALSPNRAIGFASGWIAGQFGLLTWDGLPKGRSPQMFMPTNAGEAMLYAAMIVVALNWTLVIGAPLGSVINRFVFRKSQ